MLLLLFLKRGINYWGFYAGHIFNFLLFFIFSFEIECVSADTFPVMDIFILHHQVKIIHMLRHMQHPVILLQSFSYISSLFSPHVEVEVIFLLLPCFLSFSSMAACVFGSAATEVRRKQRPLTCPLFSRVLAVWISDSDADASSRCSSALVFAWLKAFNGYPGMKRSDIIPAAGWRDDGVINSSDRQHRLSDPHEFIVLPAMVSGPECWQQTQRGTSLLEDLELGVPRGHSSGFDENSPLLLIKASAFLGAVFSTGL